MNHVSGLLALLAVGIITWLLLAVLSDMYWWWQLRRLQRQDDTCHRCCGSGRIYKSTWMPAPWYAVMLGRAENCPLCEGSGQWQPPESAYNGTLHHE